MYYVIYAIYSNFNVIKYLHKTNNGISTVEINSDVVWQMPSDLSDPGIQATFICSSPI